MSLNHVTLQIGECVANWWRPNFETVMYPYCPPHITKPKVNNIFEDVIFFPCGLLKYADLGRTCDRNVKSFSWFTCQSESTLLYQRISSCWLFPSLNFMTMSR